MPGAHHDYVELFRKLHSIKQDPQPYPHSNGQAVTIARVGHAETNREPSCRPSHLKA
jgi:hypothetical protein